MEISNSLRSLDAVTGRPIGTDRPSSSATPSLAMRRGAPPERSNRTGGARHSATSRADRSAEPRSKVANRSERYDLHSSATRGEHEDSSFDSLVKRPSSGAGAAAESVASSNTAISGDAVVPVKTNPDANESPAHGASSIAEPADATLALSIEVVAIPPTQLATAAPIAVPVLLAEPDAALAIEVAVLAEGEAIDEIDALAPGAVRRDTHGSGTPVDRLALSRSTAEAAAPEPARDAPVATSAHDTDRAAEILKQIRLRLAPDLRQATIHLSPPELGRISIQLSLDERRLTAAVRSEKRETHEALGRHLPELRAALALHGIETEHFELSLGFQHEHPGQADGRDGQRTPLAHSAAWSERRPDHDESLTRAIASASGVDLYA